MNRDNFGVIQPGQNLTFAGKALGRIRDASRGSVKDLDCDGTVQTALAGAEHPAGAAATEQLDKLVGGQLGVELRKIGSCADRAESAEGRVINSAQMFDSGSDQAAGAEAARLCRMGEAQSAFGTEVQRSMRSAHHATPCEEC